MRSNDLNRHMKVHETNGGSKMMRGQTTIDEKALEISALRINTSLKWDDLHASEPV